MVRKPYEVGKRMDEVRDGGGWHQAGSWGDLTRRAFFDSAWYNGSYCLRRCPPVTPIPSLSLEVCVRLKARNHFVLRSYLSSPRIWARSSRNGNKGFVHLFVALWRPGLQFQVTFWCIHNRESFSFLVSWRWQWGNVVMSRRGESGTVCSNSSLPTLIMKTYYEVGRSVTPGDSSLTSTIPLQMQLFSSVWAESFGGHLICICPWLWRKPEFES